MRVVLFLLAALLPLSSVAQSVDNRNPVIANRRVNAILADGDQLCVTGPCDLRAGTTVGGSPIGGGGGEVNTASNLGGGLDNFSAKVGVDLRFNTFAAADFDLSGNVFTIDATKWLTIAAAATAYQPLDSDLTSIAAVSTTAFGRGLLAEASDSTLRSTLALVPGVNVQAFDTDLNSIAALTTTAFGRGLLAEASDSTLRSTLALVPGVNVQIFDTDLDSIAALATTAHGRGLLDDVDAAASRASIGAQASDVDLDDLADGSLTGSKIGTGIAAGNITTGTVPDAQVDGAAESDEITGLADAQISDTLTASTSTTAAANDNDTSIATTAFVQQEIDDGDFLTDNCVLENDSTPIPDSCVGDGTDGGGGGGGAGYAEIAAAALAGF